MGSVVQRGITHGVGRRWLAGLALGATLGLLPAAAGGHGMVRRDDSGPGIAGSVAIPPGAHWVLVSSVLPDAADRSAPAGSPQRSGDTAAQARSVLDKIAAELATQGLGPGDIVKLTVFLVADPQRGGVPDYAGLLSAFMAYFGTGSEGLPARTTVQVAGLPVPGALVAMDAIAAHAGEPHPAAAP